MLDRIGAALYVLDWPTKQLLFMCCFKLYGITRVSDLDAIRKWFIWRWCGVRWIRCRTQAFAWLGESENCKQAGDRQERNEDESLNWKFEYWMNNTAHIRLVEILPELWAEEPYRSKSALLTKLLFVFFPFDELKYVEQTLNGNFS